MCNRAPGWRSLFYLITFSSALTQFATAEQRGIISGADASGELRAEKSETAPDVATVKPGESFSFEPEADNEWGKVTLDSGKSGWLPLGRIRLFFDKSDLPKKDPAGLSEIDEAARSRGFNYVKVTKQATQGDAKALKQFFSLAQEADGAAAESIGGMPTVVYHLLGDGKFAKYLGAQPVAYQVLVRNIIVRDGALSPTTLYLHRHFPETTKVLFPSELVAWPSPDGRYAIRKVFSDPFDMRGAKVVRAELIEKKTGQVLLDMTADDIGIGADREGEIVWSPDSKRFASLSIDMTEHPGNLFSTPRPPPQKKQTAVYQLMGESWSRVELPLDKVPGREKDTELEGAILGHDYVEPVRWQKNNVLLLERHEYYEKLKPVVVEKVKFDSIHSFARWHWITATISPEGKATVVWKLRKDR
jgi:hypothetical protein